MNFPRAVMTGNWLSGGDPSKYPAGNRFDTPFDPAQDRRRGRRCADAGQHADAVMAAIPQAPETLRWGYFVREMTRTDAKRASHGAPRSSGLSIAYRPASSSSRPAARSRPARGAARRRAPNAGETIRETIEFGVGQRSLVRGDVGGAIGNQPAHEADDRRVAYRFLEDRAAARLEDPADFARHEIEIEMVQDCDPEHDVDRVVGERQVVRRCGDEGGAAGEAADGEPALARCSRCSEMSMPQTCAPRLARSTLLAPEPQPKSTIRWPATSPSW